MNSLLISEVMPYVEAFKQQNEKKPKQPLNSPIKKTMPDSHKFALEHAKATWEQYTATAEGKEYVESLKKMSLGALEVSISQKIQGPVFKKTRKITDKLKNIKSFSIGVNFQEASISGAAITVGAAIGVGGHKDYHAAAFVSIGFMVGGVAGIDFGIEFGIWEDIPEDLKGGYWSANAFLGLDLEGGIGFICSYKPELIGFTITIGFGIEIGVYVEFGYTFTRRPTFQFRNHSLVLLKKLHCSDSSSDGPGNEDEVFFTFESDDSGTKYRYPMYSYFSMKENHDHDDWYCGRSVWCDEDIHVKLYDEDGISSKDKLGDIHIKVKDLTLNETKTYSLKSDKYNDRYKMEVVLIYTNKYYG